MSLWSINNFSNDRLFIRILNPIIHLRRSISRRIGLLLRATLCLMLFQLYLLALNDLLVSFHLRTVLVNKLLQLTILLSVIAIHFFDLSLFLADLALKLALNKYLVISMLLHLILHVINSCMRQI